MALRTEIWKPPQSSGPEPPKEQAFLVLFLCTDPPADPCTAPPLISYHPSCHLQESEKLEHVNAELKAQIEELRSEKQQLMYLLNLHRPTCIVRAQHGRSPDAEHSIFLQRLQEGTLHS